MSPWSMPPRTSYSSVKPWFVMTLFVLSVKFCIIISIIFGGILILDMACLRIDKLTLSYALLMS